VKKSLLFYFIKYFQSNFVDVNKTDSNALLSNNIPEQTKKPLARASGKCN